MAKSLSLAKQSPAIGPRKAALQRNPESCLTRFIHANGTHPASVAGQASLEKRSTA
jgi:hypothetical protein